MIEMPTLDEMWRWSCWDCPGDYENETEINEQFYAQMMGW